MILIVTALTGYCKGFVRYVITMLGTVAAVLVAFLIANMSAENVYNKYFKTQLITSLENAAEQTDLSKLVSNELKTAGGIQSVSRAGEYRKAACFKGNRP